MANSREEIVLNYYTGEKWFLVGPDGRETYISESKYLAQLEARKKLKSL